MMRLARTLRTTDYFTLGFGTMVGVGWLVLMDDWLRRGGPGGVILGFALGGAALLPIAVVYGRLVMSLPDAGSEIAWAEGVFPPWVGFAAGWIMMLAYLIVCPWEAVAIGRLTAYVFPAIESLPLYRVGGHPVYLPSLVLGLALTASITWINLRGIRLSATFQTWMTFVMLGLFVLFCGASIGRGSAAHFDPPFSHGAWMSVLLVVQIVPYFMTGFESVPKCAEEANPGFRRDGYFRAIVLALVAGIVFYTVVTALVAWLRPWRELADQRFATAAAFERAFPWRGMVDLLLLAALISLIKIFNGNFIAASRLLFALGRRGHVPAAFARVAPATLAPSNAVLALGVVTGLAACLGDAILVPITEVGSLASALGWLLACAAWYRRNAARRERTLATAGMAVAGILALLKILPGVPGGFTRAEWIALALWAAAGLAVRRRGASGSHPAAAF